jgi:hypothetical protein
VATSQMSLFISATAVAPALMHRFSQRYAGGLVSSQV